MVDAYSGWPEAYPVGKEDATSIIKHLINSYIPQHGFPRRIRSDNGSHFKNKHLQQVEQHLGLKHAFGSVYHPQSQGKVERMNQTLKTKIAKIMATGGVSNWMEALPLALMAISYTVNRSTGFSPFELHHGRPFRIPVGTVGPTVDCNPKVMYKILNHLSSYIPQAPTTPAPPPDPVEELATADHVYLRVFRRKWQEPRWSGPHKVIAQTSTAVQLQGKGASWFHLARCARTKPSSKEEKSTATSDSSVLVTSPCNNHGGCHQMDGRRTG